MTLELSGGWCWRFFFWVLLGWALVQWISAFHVLHTKWQCQHPWHTSRNKDTCICNHRVSPAHPFSLKKDLNSNKKDFSTSIYENYKSLLMSFVLTMISNVFSVSRRVEQWSWVTCSMIVCPIYKALDYLQSKLPSIFTRKLSNSSWVYVF